MTLTESQKKYLRGLGHHLKPVVEIGNAGLSESLLNEFELTLNHHELIKVKVRAGDHEQRDEMITTLCKTGKADLIQRIGSIALIYRPNPDKNRIRLPR